MQNKVSVISESSWDVECLKRQNYDIEKYLLHNDYFIKGMNSENTRLVNRLLSMIRILIFLIKAVLRNKTIILTSFNFELVFIASLFYKYEKIEIFCPNVMSSPKGKSSRSSVRLDKFLEKYKERIVVTDEISYQTLKLYKPRLSDNYYGMNIPKNNEIDKLVFIVVLPAVLSHKATNKKSNDFYKHALRTIKWLENNNLDFRILPHPREEGVIKSKDLQLSFNKFIVSNEIRKIKKNKCYLSSFSSLSLNKRYGGDFGFWVKFDDISILPKDFPKDSTNYLSILNEK